MLVHWRSDLDQGKHDPLEVVSVITKTGSTISAALVVPLDPVAGPIRAPEAGQEADGLMAVIEEQMSEIDRLATDLRKAKSEIVERDNIDLADKGAAELVEHITDCVQNLCVALGYARNPMQRTGIAELDELLEAVR